MSTQTRKLLSDIADSGIKYEEAFKAANKVYKTDGDDWADRMSRAYVKQQRAHNLLLRNIRRYKKHCK